MGHYALKGECMHGVLSQNLKIISKLKHENTCLEV